MVGQPLTLQCNATTVRGIESRVDIVWMTSNGTIIRRMLGITATTMNTSLVYTDYYTISQLNTDDDSRTYRCEVVINSSPPVITTSEIVLDVIG